MFKTAFNGYAVKFSPFLESRLAVATSQNFGIIGSGRQYVLDLTPNGFVPVCSFDTPDGLYDCTWSEVAGFPSFSLSLSLFLFFSPCL
jgi:peroxin-7